MYVTKFQSNARGMPGWGGWAVLKLYIRMECPPFKFPSAQSAQYKSYIYSLLTSSLRDPCATHAARPVETPKKEIALTKRSFDSISCKL